jgi:hypothetical protein
MNFNKYLMKEKIMQERIIPNIRLTGSGCWEWQKQCTEQGYGMVSVDGVRWYAHRLVCSLFHGPLEAGVVVRHRCNNRKCSNPDHLVKGTHSDNVQDNHGSGTRSGKCVWTRARKPNGLDGEQLIEWVRQHGVDVDLGSGCWLARSCNEHGYSIIYVAGKSRLLHRYIYCVRHQLSYEDKSFVVRHLCHNKRCANPDHLIHGTQRDNSLDSRADYSHVKLCDEIVLKIAHDFVITSFAAFGSLDRFVRRWAEELKVTPSAIYQITQGKTWSDITGPILAAKAHEWRPRNPSTKLNPEIVRNIKADFANWNFTETGQKRRFDRHWAAISGIAERTVASIRNGDRWGWVR